MLCVLLVLPGPFEVQDCSGAEGDRDAGLRPFFSGPISSSILPPSVLHSQYTPALVCVIDSTSTGPMPRPVLLFGPGNAVPFRAIEGKLRTYTPPVATAPPAPAILVFLTTAEDGSPHMRVSHSGVHLRRPPLRLLRVTEHRDFHSPSAWIPKKKDKTGGADTLLSPLRAIISPCLDKARGVWRKRGLTLRLGVCKLLPPVFASHPSLGKKEEAWPEGQSTSYFQAEHILSMRARVLPLVSCCDCGVDWIAFVVSHLVKSAQQHRHDLEPAFSPLAVVDPRTHTAARTRSRRRGCVPGTLVVHSSRLTCLASQKQQLSLPPNPSSLRHHSLPAPAVSMRILSPLLELRPRRLSYCNANARRRPIASLHLYSRRNCSLPSRLHPCILAVCVPVVLKLLILQRRRRGCAHLLARRRYLHHCRPI
ncbi:hypothetical protein R3P38DRAFT_3262344 [Favolaschia claudopus]|uniref:Uncharacterized protein n=1 Tax=Favolaschia claudopus TaxID=2862362 RepID=A0AAW0CMT9_9AGAR